MIAGIPTNTQRLELKVFKSRLLRFFSGRGVILIALILLLAGPHRAIASVEQKSFPSPQLAVAALVVALQNSDGAELLSLFGPGSEQLIFSGDKVADQNGRARFLKAYGQRHGFEQVNNDRVTLLIGGKDYPFPIPIIRQGAAWLFDARAGREEILNRRIGRNELNTIEVVKAYADAQREYACLKFNGDTPEFAQKFSSSAGKKDGLYWTVIEGEKESPFGPLIAKATGKGYLGGLDEEPPEPFQGYYFKILKAQGKHATGGAFDYVADGKMVLGFALVAYPAKYGASGIMTFTVNQEGVIYEKDLGETTTETVAAMTTFDPDSSWRNAEKGSKSQ